MNDKNRKIIAILSIFTIIFTLMGGTLAYWNWSSDIRTGVAFTISKEFSCSADGGQDLNATNVELAPTADCTNSDYALQRTIKVTSDIDRTGLSINLDMWLKVNNIDPELAASNNLMYAISTVPGSCRKGMDGYITSGNFKGTNTDSKVDLLKNKTYSVTTTDTYYLYIWLDAAETDIATAGKTFDLSLGGQCTDTPAPEAPVLDDGMIPVTIANDGTVTIVSKDDPSWYNYSEKEWANVVLVSEQGAGAEESRTREYYQNPENIGDVVTQEDILAYYVWIPRYKYRIPTTIYCEDIENPTKEEHYICYTPPYELLIPYNDFLDRIISYVGLEYGHCEVNDIYDEYGEWIDEEIICTEENLADIREEAIIYADELLNTGYYGEDLEISIEELLSTTDYTMKFNKYNLWNKGPTTIDIVFESIDAPMKSGDAIANYLSHPAFWWDNDSDGILDTGETVPGIWVGKFETTPDKSSTCYTAVTEKNCNNATQNPTILPNTVSLRYQDVGNQFYTSRNIGKEGNAYGLDNNTINAHMMKNRDWGAVAYLSHSVYGINKEVYVNNSGGYYTGRSGGNTSASSFKNTYGTYTWLGQTVDTDGNIGAYAADRTLGTNASTTGNVTGVYDMSEGTSVYVMGLYGPIISRVSGFKELPESKYYDLYSEDDFPEKDSVNLAHCTIETCGGHALYETAAWYNDFVNFVTPNESWLIRGGSSGESSGLFQFGSNSGSGAAAYSWRSVLVPGFGD